MDIYIQKLVNLFQQIILEMFRSIGKISEKLELENGYRIISNIGDDGGQEVPHFHIHILGKKKMTKILGIGVDFIDNERISTLIK